MGGSRVAKCDFCRRDKKKCTWSRRSTASGLPATQAELSERCDWCIKFRFPCSEQRLASESRAQGDIPNRVVLRLHFRTTTDIVHDFDCILYLLAGILDYDDHQIKITPTSDRLDGIPPTPNPLDNSDLALRLELPLYQELENDLVSLYQNFNMFNKAKDFCKRSLEAELEKLRKEGGTVVEYLNSNKKIYETAVLLNLLTASPEYYTTKSIEARHANRSQSGHLDTLLKNEKDCGHLFLYIKAATLPSNSNVSRPKSLVRYCDIEKAQRLLDIVIEKRLQGTTIQALEESISSSRTVYHNIDPLEHRFFFLGEEFFWSARQTLVTRLIQPQPRMDAMVIQRNLLGETGIGMTRRNDPNDTDFYRGLSISGNITIDIRGADFVLKSILDTDWDFTVWSLSQPTERRKKERHGAFFLDVEVPGLEAIRKSFPDIHSDQWVYLDANQLVTLMGNFDYLVRSTALIPQYSAQFHASLVFNEYDKVYISLKGVIPELTLGERHPVILSALAGYVDITRYHLERCPVLSKPQSGGGLLEALFLIAFKRGDLELLRLLNETAAYELDSSKRILLSSQASELAAPAIFHEWMNLAWFDLSGVLWGLMDIRCELWRRILSSLWVRFEGTQGIENQGIQNEKLQFIEVIWAMERSMYLARCVCPGCQEYYVKFHQVLGA